jgi:hypothetical protein
MIFLLNINHRIDLPLFFLIFYTLDIYIFVFFFTSSFKNSGKSKLSMSDDWLYYYFSFFCIKYVNF